MAFDRLLLKIKNTDEALAEHLRGISSMERPRCNRTRVWPGRVDERISDIVKHSSETWWHRATRPVPLFPGTAASVHFCVVRPGPKGRTKPCFGSHAGPVVSLTSTAKH